MNLCENRCECALCLRYPARVYYIEYIIFIQEIKICNKTLRLNSFLGKLIFLQVLMRLMINLDQFVMNLLFIK